jgi:hypothetical protein
LQKATQEKTMNSTQVTELKARIQRIEAANAFYQNAHNAKIVEAAKKELFDATGEVLVDGRFVKQGAAVSKQAHLIAVYRAKVAQYVADGDNTSAAAYIAGLRVVSARIIAGQITM